MAFRFDEQQFVDNLGKVLKESRGKLSFNQVAEGTDGLIQSMQVYRLEQGKIARPSFADVYVLAKFFGIPLSEIVEKTGLEPIGGEEDVKSASENQRKVMTLVRGLFQTAEEGDLDYLVQFLEVYNGYLRARPGMQFENRVASTV